jgi:uncharacterized protein YjbI with pentapeptide repeats
MARATRARAAQPQARRPPRLPEPLTEATQPPWDEPVWSGLELSADLPGESLAGIELRELRWSGRLPGAQLRGVRLVDVVFDRCDLSGVAFDRATLHRVEFRSCRMSGAVLAGATCEDVLVTGCTLHLANLRQLEGRRLHVVDSDLRDADLAGARLTDSRLIGSQLDGAEFSGATLTDVRLHGSSVLRIGGVTALTGALIDAEQELPLALQLLHAAGLRVVPDEPGALPGASG